MNIDPHILEWLSLLTRWIHVIVGIAWIGASFYFNWLEGHLERENKAEDIAGDIWSVHGGGFYHAVKYKLAPPKLPTTLHWFYWEAYGTWISGMVLLAIVYHSNPTVYMIDPAVADLSPIMAVSIGLGTLLLGWLVYDVLCRSALVDKPRVLALVGFAGIVAVAYALTNLLGGRAAYLHVGAMLGTIMVGNVAMMIIPGQRRLVAALTEGRAPDAKDAKQALTRSRHNNYITLPVLLLMVSNHYPSSFGHQWSWLILSALVLIGVGVRHYYNLKHKGNHKVWMLVVAACALAAVAWFAAPKPVEVNASNPVSDDVVMSIVQKHCVSCHAANPSDAVFKTAPNGVLFESIEQLRQRSAQVKSRVVDTHSMPLGNTTKMSVEERKMLGQWIAAQ